MAGSTERSRIVGWTWWQHVTAGLAYALLVVLAFPPANVWVLAFAAPLPMIWTACRAAERPMRGALLFAVGVLPLWFFEQRWMIDVTSLGYPVLAVYLSLCSAFGVYLLARIRRRATGIVPIPLSMLAPLTLGAAEVLRGEVLFTGYAWYLAGHPLIESAALAAPASVFGAYFVSFLVYTLAGAAADAAGWSGVPRARGGQAAVCIAAIWFITSWIGARQAEPDVPSLTMDVAAIQTNIPQSNKMGWDREQRRVDMRRFMELTRHAAESRPPPDVIIWPETMFPGLTLSGPAIREFERAWGENNPGLVAAGERHWLLLFGEDLLKMQAEIGVPMIVGAIAMPDPPAGLRGRYEDRPDFGREHNSAFLIESGLVQDARYDKIDLTPFGEVIPYVWRFPKLQQKLVELGAKGMSFSLAPGEEPVTLPVTARVIENGVITGHGVRVAVPICFEVTRSALCRSLVVDGPRMRAAVIINISNDGWFGHFEGGREQHLQAARWRCVELGVPMVRSVNTGISAAVDARGRIIQYGPQGREPEEADGVMSARLEIRPDRQPTIYGRIGNLWAWLTMLGAGVWWLWRVVRG